MRKFEDTEVRGLITTDVMARGLIFQISPMYSILKFLKFRNSYIHRIGRTGRADKDGTAISFITKKEEALL